VNQEVEAVAGQPVRACPLCGTAGAPAWALAHDVEYYTSPDAFLYRRCPVCAAIFIDPVPLDRLGEIYPSNYYSYAAATSGLVQRAKDALDRRLFRRLLRAFPDEELAVLDVGGGSGALASAVRAADPRVTTTTVVDLDSSARDLAVAAGHEFHHGRVEEFHPARRYHLVLLLNLIEHVDDPRSVLAGVHHALADGGVALVKTPNVASLDARLFRHRDWGGYHCPRHWVLFTRENLEDLAGQCGLRVRRSSYTQGAPFWAVSVLAWLQRGRPTDRPLVQHPLYAPLTGAFAAFDLTRARLGGHPSQMFLELEHQ
jgi:SAM-dependent methyltransferase